jgi:hypothetical protein
MFFLMTDRTRTGESDRIQAGEYQVLEMIASDALLADILATVCRLTEQDIPGSVCCIMLRDTAANIFHDAVVPSLPALGQALEGQPATAECGACGAACERREAVVVADIASDPLTKDLRGPILGLGLRACWSKPMLSPRNGEVIGSFAVYRRTAPSVPSAAELEHRDILLRWATIAIERRLRERDLRESEEHLRYTFEMNPQIPWTAKPDGRMITVSQRWLDFTGLTMAETLNHGWTAAVHPDDLDRTWAAWTQALGSGEPVDAEFRLRTTGGT